jgi:hypothetical protein
MAKTKWQPFKNRTQMSGFQMYPIFRHSLYTVDLNDGLVFTFRTQGKVLMHLIIRSGLVLDPTNKINTIFFRILAKLSGLQILFPIPTKNSKEKFADI